MLMFPVSSASPYFGRVNVDIKLVKKIILGMLLNIVAGKVFGINFVKKYISYQNRHFSVLVPLTFILQLETICTIGCYITIYAEISCINSNCTFLRLSLQRGVYGYFHLFLQPQEESGSIEVAIAATTMPDKSLFDF